MCDRVPCSTNPSNGRRNQIDIPARDRTDPRFETHVDRSYRDDGAPRSLRADRGTGLAMLMTHVSPNLGPA